MTQTAETILALVQKLLEFLGVGAEVTVEYDEANNTYQVNLACDNPGVLIGRHGETLSALQLMVGQHLKAQTGEWVNIVVNVNDYRQRREQTLQQLADRAVEQVVATGQPHSLPPMPANERRLVHMYLAEHNQVKTESMGEGRTRSIVVSPKA